jgi:chromosome segregation ATPase
VDEKQKIAEKLAKDLNGIRKEIAGNKENLAKVEKEAKEAKTEISSTIDKLRKTDLALRDAVKRDHEKEQRLTKLAQEFNRVKKYTLELEEKIKSKASETQEILSEVDDILGEIDE